MDLFYKKKALNTKVARRRDVHRVVKGEAVTRGRKAKAKLAAHKHAGHSAIEVTEGQVDAYVMLTDERGQWAAAAIEYGRGEYQREVLKKDGKVVRYKVGATEGVGALAAAMRG